MCLAECCDFSNCKTTQNSDSAQRYPAKFGAKRQKHLRHWSDQMSFVITLSFGAELHHRLKRGTVESEDG